MASITLKSVSRPLADDLFYGVRVLLRIGLLILFVECPGMGSFISDPPLVRDFVSLSVVRFAGQCGTPFLRLLQSLSSFSYIQKEALPLFFLQ